MYWFGRWGPEIEKGTCFVLTAIRAREIQTFGSSTLREKPSFPFGAHSVFGPKRPKPA